MNSRMYLKVEKHFSKIIQIFFFTKADEANVTFCHRKSEYNTNMESLV